MDWAITKNSIIWLGTNLQNNYAPLLTLGIINAEYTLERFQKSALWVGSLPTPAAVKKLKEDHAQLWLFNLGDVFRDKDVLAAKEFIDRSRGGKAQFASYTLIVGFEDQAGLNPATIGETLPPLRRYTLFDVVARQPSSRPINWLRRSFAACPTTHVALLPKTTG